MYANVCTPGSCLWKFVLRVFVHVRISTVGVCTNDSVCACVCACVDGITWRMLIYVRSNNVQHTELTHTYVHCLHTYNVIHYLCVWVSVLYLHRFTLTYVEVPSLFYFHDFLYCTYLCFCAPALIAQILTLKCTPYTSRLVWRNQTSKGKARYMIQ